ncbi:hypothetical protein ACL03H_12025 [Saccharopolyspora sp. MS10]|uniref:hypothetical protein n=1 Tax=Saccharopolyspora sp. MS10 TaxID=3385973 RepID=UPI0039A0BAD6
MSVEWARRMRRRLGLAGILLVTCSLVIAVLGIPWMFSLPVGRGAGTIMLAGFLFVSTFFSCGMGVLSLLGRSYLNSGWLNLTQAQGLRRSSLAVWIFSAIGGGLSTAALALASAAAARDGAQLGAETLFGFVVVLSPVALSGFAWCAVVRKILV